MMLRSLSAIQKGAMITKDSILSIKTKIPATKKWKWMKHEYCDSVQTHNTLGERDSIQYL